jgi:hypothetical protein
MRVIQILEFGDSEGHPFHGNQWTENPQSKELFWKLFDQPEGLFYEDRIGHLDPPLQEHLKQLTADYGKWDTATAQERLDAKHEGAPWYQNLAGFVVNAPTNREPFFRGVTGKPGEHVLSNWTRDEDLAASYGGKVITAEPGTLRAVDVHFLDPDNPPIDSWIGELSTVTAAGDLPGHDFRGNQWTGGKSGDAREGAKLRVSKFTSPTGQPMTRTQIGDTMEALVVNHPEIRGALRARYGGPITPLVGKQAGTDRQNPLDLIVGEHGAELKSVHAESTTQGTTMKRSEAIDKETQAKEMGLKPLQLGVVWEPKGDSFFAHLYAKEGFVPGRFRTQFEHLGTFPVSADDFAAAFGRATA